MPLIQKFEAGYVQGAKAVAPDIEIDVKYLSPAGDFTGFNDPAKGQVVASGQLDARRRHHLPRGGRVRAGRVPGGQGGTETSWPSASTPTSTTCRPTPTSRTSS